ncbi:sugar phosphate isomerase/epimerase [Clostridium acetobutylicum]|uniref:Predicted endonuclease n=1 Tax=Clostridium acetobutylicum (strain ATCC 824 / DSM 792 / JCM 1419 / IAM 19013 / LMG 5710 / NBRC 13948 / NRRL B-527 / VKM B-1787 / 2291 / W) TaxID=272562 RepID=Q97FT5_CLOAB|nr:MULTISPECIES: sugar phosphate isomerase/epimerase [Clostridium]AAK80589.1 Predicted endonuclease [Clostridium acetobutylicum ATCC 824]ADZ21688.1 endonuclease [Clostridium acetobutylicum EA 2018]AEI32480.1 endonuclease [Clostridium acetobutylicum DSM 1731]AWV78994.1 sugar phosphate isomerase/epimerase [Clostridium acetobutylicum]KHD38742.1 AP endonuclease [Clostridium acetobutylicum]
MEIGLSSAVFYPEVNTEDTLEIIKKLGFNTCEVFINSFLECEDGFVDKLLRKKHELNIDINSVHALSSLFEPFLFDPYKRRRDEMLLLFEKICKTGSKLGASYYTFHGMKYKDFSCIDRELAVEVYKKIAYIAGENNIKLAQENVSWCMSSDIDYLSFIKDKSIDNLFFTFDIKQAYKANKEPKEYIRVMGNKLVNFHINDRDEDHVCLLPLDGTVNYKEIFYELDNVNYDGNLIIEVYRNNFFSYNEISDCKKKLEKFL